MALLSCYKRSVNAGCDHTVKKRVLRTSMGSLLKAPVLDGLLRSIAAECSWNDDTCYSSVEVSTVVEGRWEQTVVRYHVRISYGCCAEAPELGGAPSFRANGR
jgi:hypothetical protein